MAAWLRCFENFISAFLLCHHIEDREVTMGVLEVKLECPRSLGLSNLQPLSLEMEFLLERSQQYMCPSFYLWMKKNTLHIDSALLMYRCTNLLRHDMPSLFFYLVFNVILL